MKKISKSKAFELLKNKKIFVGNSKISELVQDQLFKAGYKWRVDGAKIVNTTYNFLYTNSYKITFDDSIDFYNKSDKKEISAMEILSWEIVEDKTVFKIRQEALMRSDNTCEWAYCIYSHYDKDRDMHVASGGIYYKQCIPYEGNESLLGTTKSPEEVEE